MAGHSKWANIRHRKGRQDAKRGKLFTRLIRETTVAARLGGADLSSNPRLRAAVEVANSANMPKDTIARAISRGAGGNESDNYVEIRYEGYGPGGVAIIVDCMTDNRNRTVSEVRHAFTKSGGNLGTDGSVSYLFTKVGLLNFDAGVDENDLLDAALNAGATDIISGTDGSFEVISAPDEFVEVKNLLETSGFLSESSEVTMRSETNVALESDNALKMLRLLDSLEELEDVQKVYSNGSISDEFLVTLGN